MNISYDQRNNETDAEQVKKEVVLVFNQTEIDTASTIEIFPEKPFHTIFGSSSNPENFMNESAFIPTHYASMQNDDDDDQFPSVRKRYNCNDVRVTHAHAISSSFQSSI